ncbi:hypothetical protein [Sphingomonas phyllosphaerae]|uniref:hypothetical protein n=1 Tax=Sphingomonas phyllosphaerae TaxID=257003 RepID=UPI000416E657|nr:hypothetical protein [Sphingomonas phyllosphaerae]
MKATLGQVRDGVSAIAAAMAAARSARNQATRAARAEVADSRRSAQRYKQARAREDRERERAMNRRFRVRVPEHERPRSRGASPRKLFYRVAGQAIGTRVTDGGSSRAGVRSIHFAVTARGFASTKGRRWRTGEGERAAQYITREEALEGGEHGWWSNIAADRIELVAFFRASEAMERHDRVNANVYISEVLSLPAPLTAQGRREAVEEYCRYFDERGLPYVAAPHLPDPGGDQRNFHCHIVYSTRPAERLAPYDWSFAVSKLTNVNTPDAILARRKLAVDVINAALCAAGSALRYTHLSNRARGTGAPSAKQGQKGTWVLRRLAAAEQRAGQLTRLRAMVTPLREGLALSRRVEVLGKSVAARLAAAKTIMVYSGQQLAQQRSAARTGVGTKLRATLASSSPVPNNLDVLGAVADERRRRQETLVAARAHLFRPPPDYGAVRSKLALRLAENRSYTHTSTTSVIERWKSVRDRLAADLPAAKPSINTGLAARLATAGERMMERQRLELLRDTLDQGRATAPQTAGLRDLVRERLAASMTVIADGMTTTGDRMRMVMPHMTAKADIVERERHPAATAIDAETQTAAVTPIIPAAPDYTARHAAALENQRMKDEKARDAGRRAAVRASALARLEAENVTITLSAAGEYRLSARALTDEQKAALRDPAYIDETTMHIERLYEAQQARAGAKVEAEPSTATSSMPADIDEGLSDLVRFQTKSDGRGTSRT